MSDKKSPKAQPELESHSRRELIVNTARLGSLGVATSLLSPAQKAWAFRNVIGFWRINTVTGLFAWGSNTNGQLGGAIAGRITPTTNWAFLGTQSSTSMAVKTDGTLWTWGYNFHGQLGDGTTVNKNSPIQVGSLSDWSEVVGAALSAVARKTDGTLWAWGQGTSGVLGVGSSTNLSSPVQIGALSDWSKIAGGYRFFLAKKTGGTLWAWGEGEYGQLGDGNSGFSYSRSSPIQVGALSNWSKVACGSYHSMAIKTNGTLWVWGYNYQGQLGWATWKWQQIGGLANWKSGSLGQTHTVAVKTDGTLWTWGDNQAGKLAD